MYCYQNLPNDQDVRDVMMEKDFKEIVSFFNRCKTIKKLHNWKEVKVVALNGLFSCYSCICDEVLDEIVKTQKVNNEDSL